MCGIVVVLGDSSEAAEDTLVSMRERLIHRGPDGAGLWVEDFGERRVGLAHRRLAILDLRPVAEQPMHGGDGNISIVFNGEIYNYVELKNELSRHGHVFNTECDTEVLLNAYLEWGRDCLQRLNGMFAFAIWDSRRKEMFVARDRFGEKPLFYAYLKNGIAFASEMKALFAHPDIHPEPDMETLDSYLQSSRVMNGEKTFFSGIYRFPRSHAAILDSNGKFVAKWRYWLPGYEKGLNISIQEATEQFKDLLFKSVRMRLRSDVPVGSSLSGGLDSTTIVCILAGLRENGKINVQKTFSACFDDEPDISEKEFLDAAIEKSRAEAFSVIPTPELLMEESRIIHYHQEEPFLSASIFLQWSVMKLARENGVVVLLDGQGADELLAGYLYYFRLRQLDLLDSKKYIRLILETLMFAHRMKKAAAIYPEESSRASSKYYYDRRRLNGYRKKPPKVYTASDGEGLPSPLPGMRMRRRMAESLLYTSLPSLLRYADRNAMAFGRETRFPFLDYKLVDWLVGLPDNCFINNGWTKYILRRSTRDIIPEKIRLRADKVGYAAPMARWFRGPLKTWTEEKIFHGEITHLDSYDKTDTKTKWEDLLESRADTSWAIWKLLSLNEWLSLLSEWKKDAS